MPVPVHQVSKTHLVQVIVRFKTDGSLDPIMFSYLDQTPLPRDTPLRVNVGDRVAWNVLVNSAVGRRAFPYDLTFADKAFFGVDKVSVPEGGTSAFLPVRSVQGRTSWTLNVTGIGCVFDPDVQSGNDTSVVADLTPPSYSVTWDLDHVPPTLTWKTAGAGDSHNFPMDIKTGDTIDFQVRSVIPVPSYQVDFDLATEDTLWASPQSYSENLFPGRQRMNVYDTGDVGNSFVFFMQSSGLVPSPQGEMRKTA